jgi:phosphate-selective porin OprO/OprP
MAAAPAAAQIPTSTNTVQSLFYKEIEKDGRIYVFNNPDEAARFEKSGEIGRAITRIGVGPNGETVVADSETALELFFFKHGISEKVERPKDPPLNIVWRDGKTRFTLGSNFYMEMSNRIQIRYSHELPDDTVTLPGTGSAGDDKGSFRIRRAKFKLEGWFYKPYLQYEVQMNWPGAVGSNVGAFLEDANINWDLTQGAKRLMVRAGQNKVPFGLQELISSGSQQFVDRALSSNLYFRGRDTGANVWGVLGNNKFEYRAGIYNGNGLTRPANDNDKFQKNARFTWQPNGAVPLGIWGSGPHMTESDMDTRALGRRIFTVSAAFEENDLSFADPAIVAANIKSRLYTVDSLYKWKGLFLTGAFTWAERDPQDPAVSSFDSEGGFFQGGYFLKPDIWEVAFRYGWHELNTDTGFQVKETGGAVNYFYNKHNLKVQADFRRITTEGATRDTSNHEFRIQTQFIF